MIPLSLTMNTDFVIFKKDHLLHYSQTQNTFYKRHSNFTTFKTHASQYILIKLFSWKTYFDNGKSNTMSRISLYQPYNF
jgi:hypothetical protein